MSVKIRLQRTGKRDNPYYRIVACEEQVKRNGKTIAVLGCMDATKKPFGVKVNREELKRWLSCGAIPTQAVRKLLSL